jgi:hypothetical protein
MYETRQKMFAERYLFGALALLLGVRLVLAADSQSVTFSCHVHIVSCSFGLSSDLTENTVSELQRPVT